MLFIPSAFLGPWGFSGMISKHQDAMKIAVTTAKPSEPSHRHTTTTEKEWHKDTEAHLLDNKAVKL